MSDLPSSHVRRFIIRQGHPRTVLECCDQLLRERARIAAVLADLPASWAQVRRTLNELQSIVRD